mmetsp:Transcript_42498/g.92337  ORF Transcript_42498/g.92337 Transcript_42498/m.92337 type:complete len:297 (+) Transcript_42498:403-1293(+)
MEHKVHRLVDRQALLLLDVLLGIAQDRRRQLHVAGRVHTVHVAERGSDRVALGGDGLQGLVHLQDLLRLGVEVLLGDVRVVDAVLLTTGDAQLHLQQDAHGLHLLEVLLADLQVLGDGLLRQIEHVRREQGLALLLEELLVGLHHAVHPGQQLLRAVVGVKHHGDAVVLGDLAHVHGAGDAAGNRGLLVLVGDGLAGDGHAAAVGELHHDGRVGLLGALHRRVDDGRRGAVDGRDGVAVDLGVLHQVNQVLAVHHAVLELGGGRRRDGLAHQRLAAGAGRDHALAGQGRLGADHGA